MAAIPHYQVFPLSATWWSVSNGRICATVVTTAIKLLTKPVLRRTLHRIRGVLSGGTSPRAHGTAGSSPTPRLPLEIVEIIVANLLYETTNLLACSLTCYSWHIATIPHLHHTLIITTYDYDLCTDKKFVWPEPLRDMHKFGLLPLVKKFQVYGEPDCVNGFSQRLFNCRILRSFSALINVQELGIDYLNTPKFMPRVQQYFGHFSLTVRSLALRAQRARRQIIYFIGLFQHLEDLKLLYDLSDPHEEPVDDLTLIPPFAPPPCPHCVDS